MNHKPLIFLGHNTNLDLFIDIASRAGMTIYGIIDSNYYLNQDMLNGVPVIDSEESFQDSDTLQEYKKNYNFFVATNNNIEYQPDIEKRQKLIDIVDKYKLVCANLIDPSSYIGSNTVLGQGIYIGPFTYIEPNVTIEDMCTIHTNTAIGHDSILQKNCVMQRKAGVMPYINIGKNAYIGLHSQVLAKYIGDNAIINPHLFVTRDVNHGEHVTMSKEAVRVYRQTTNSN